MALEETRNTAREELKSSYFDSIKLSVAATAGSVLIICAVAGIFYELGKISGELFSASLWLLAGIALVVFFVSEIHRLSRQRDALKDVFLQEIHYEDLIRDSRKERDIAKDELLALKSELIFYRTIQNAVQPADNVSDKKNGGNND